MAERTAALQEGCHWLTIIKAGGTTAASLDPKIPCFTCDGKRPFTSPTSGICQDALDYAESVPVPQATPLCTIR